MSCNCRSAKSHRHRFTICSAPHDPSIVATIPPASATDITGPPVFASDPSKFATTLSNIIMAMPLSWAATNAPTNETAIFTIQPKTHRFLVHASWIPTASAAEKKASAIIIDPPMLACGIDPVHCRSRMPITASNVMYCTRFVRSTLSVASASCRTVADQ